MVGGSSSGTILSLILKMMLVSSDRADPIIALSTTILCYF